MRQFKFRVWHPNREYFVVLGMTPFELQVDALYSTEPPFIINECECVWEQYTGLKDSDGQEIYEGDILLIKYNTTIGHQTIKGQVKYRAPSFVLSSSELLNYNIYNYEIVNVIGNIHDTK